METKKPHLDYVLILEGGLFGKIYPAFAVGEEVYAVISRVICRVLMGTVKYDILTRTGKTSFEGKEIDGAETSEDPYNPSNGYILDDWPEEPVEEVVTNLYKRQKIIDPEHELTTNKVFYKLHFFRKSGRICSHDFKNPQEIENINLLQITSLSDILRFANPLSGVYVDDYAILTMANGDKYAIKIDEHSLLLETFSKINKGG